MQTALRMSNGTSVRCYRFRSCQLLASWRNLVFITAHLPVLTMILTMKMMMLYDVTVDGFRSRGRRSYITLRSVKLGLGLGLGLRPQNVGLGLDHILVIVKLLRTVAHVMSVK